MATNPLPVNTFYDINKLPKDWGIIVFPISMSRIENSQSAQKCMDYIRIFNGHPSKEYKDTKVSAPKIGLNFFYADLLYTYFYKDASVLRKSFLPQIIKHKNGLQQRIDKSFFEIQIKHAISFQTWMDIWINSVPNFSSTLANIKRIFDKDTYFQSLVDQDCNFFKKKCTENQIMFFLEEGLMFYLLLYEKILLNNQYVDHRQNWILMAYPGVPPKSLVYITQQNPLKLRTDNPYIGQYNLENKKFYEFSRIDLDTWNYQ